MWSNQSYCYQPQEASRTPPGRTRAPAHHVGHLGGLEVPCCLSWEPPSSVLEGLLGSLEVHLGGLGGHLWGHLGGLECQIGVLGCYHGQRLPDKPKKCNLHCGLQCFVKIMQTIWPAPQGQRACVRVFSQVFRRWKDMEIGASVHVYTTAAHPAQTPECTCTRVFLPPRPAQHQAKQACAHVHAALGTAAAVRRGGGLAAACPRSPPPPLATAREGTF